ncbi:MAG: serine/threonine protein kinase, partial [Candidatus Obscuribacterales bacterium]|nr:serine/threonine protein kinase [Candidatus Obscuribacterales bacterium]
EALPLFEQVLEGIDEAHKNRVIHRDLKPDNIVLQDVDLKLPRDSENLIRHNAVRVVDFGVAKMWGEAGGSSANLTIEGKVCGSPAYMSPEQCKGAEVDARSDIYSLGVVFFEVLTGQRPFAADDLMALMLMHVNKEAPSIGSMLPDVTFPPGLSNVIIKALSKNPEDRPQSVEEFWHEIEAVCRGRRVVKASEENQTEDWIPFTGSGSSNVSLSNRSSKEWSLLDSSRPASLLEEGYDWSRATAEMSSTEKKRKKRTNIFALNHLKTGIYAAVIILSIAYVGQAYTNWNDARIAIQLFDSGNYSGCIQVLKGLEGKHALSKELRERMSDCYVRLADDYVKKRDYKKAVSLLENVPEDSKFAKKTSDLLDRYRPRAK